jgi:glycosyltransferase involved in cell wall biosynthesis
MRKRVLDISIIVPVYNVEKYLSESIFSLNNHDIDVNYLY